MNILSHTHVRVEVRCSQTCATRQDWENVRATMCSVYRARHEAQVQQSHVEKTLVRVTTRKELGSCCHVCPSFFGNAQIDSWIQLRSLQPGLGSPVLGSRKELLLQNWRPFGLSTKTNCVHVALGALNTTLPRNCALLGGAYVATCCLLSWLSCHRGLQAPKKKSAINSSRRTP